VKFGYGSKALLAPLEMVVLLGADCCTVLVLWLVPLLSVLLEAPLPDALIPSSLPLAEPAVMVFAAVVVPPHQDCSIRASIRANTSSAPPLLLLLVARREE
jgi:hypothetical protein